MSLAISGVYFSGFEEVFACKEKSYVFKLVIFTNDESSR